MHPAGTHVPVRVHQYTKDLASVCVRACVCVARVSITPLPLSHQCTKDLAGACCLSQKCVPLHMLARLSSCAPKPLHAATWHTLAFSLPPTPSAHMPLSAPPPRCAPKAADALPQDPAWCSLTGPCVVLSYPPCVVPSYPPCVVPPCPPCVVASYPSCVVPSYPPCVVHSSPPCVVHSSPPCVVHSCPPCVVPAPAALTHSAPARAAHINHEQLPTLLPCALHLPHLRLLLSLLQHALHTPRACTTSSCPPYTPACAPPATAAPPAQPAPWTRRGCLLGGG